MKNNIIALLLIGLAGCANLEVDPEERDTSGQYTGTWNGTVELTRELQDHGTVKWTCPRFSLPIKMQVKDGFINIVLGDGSVTTSIAKGGNFYTDGITDGGQIFRFRGRLNAAANTGSGVMILTQSDVESTIENSGCSADFAVERV